MRNLLFMVLLAFGAYKGYEHFINASTGAYDEQGNPLTLVFTLDGCGSYCDDAIKMLKKRRVNFIEYNISQDEENASLMKKYGGNHTVPYIVTGNRHLTGYNKHELIGTLAEVYGENLLSRSEKKLLRKHFDDNGLPQVVMYSAERCGYCKKAKAYFESEGVAYVERDIDNSSSAKLDYKRLEGSGTPLIYVGYKRLSGFNKKKVEKALQVL